MFTIAAKRDARHFAILLHVSFLSSSIAKHNYTQQTTPRDFICSVSEFTDSTGSIHVFPYVNLPDSVNTVGVSTHVCHEIMIFSCDDTYQF